MAQKFPKDSSVYGVSNEVGREDILVYAELPHSGQMTKKQWTKYKKEIDTAFERAKKDQLKKESTREGKAHLAWQKDMRASGYVV